MPSSVMSFVRRRSTLCSGRPCRALRGIVVAGGDRRIAVEPAGDVDHVAVGQRRRLGNDDGVGGGAGGRQIQAVRAGLAVDRRVDGAANRLPEP